MPFPWPLVQFALNFFEELLRDVRKVGTLGNVLTDESVGILVGARRQEKTLNTSGGTSTKSRTAQ